MAYISATSGKHSVMGFTRVWSVFAKKNGALADGACSQQIGIDTSREPILPTPVQFVYAAHVIANNICIVHADGADP